MPRPPRSTSPRSLVSMLVIFFTVAPAGADPRDQLGRIWDLHLANPSLAAGTTITIQPEHGPMDMEATWADGVSGTYSLEQPTTFEFLEFVGEQSMRVRDRYDDVLTLSRTHLDHLRRDRRALLRRKLDAFKSPVPRFAVGDAVRVRRRGMMTAGTIVALGARVRVAVGADVFDARPTGVFRALGPTPRTVSYATTWFRLGPPRGLARKYFDAVARWSSGDEFLALPPREQMRALAQAVVVFMPWHYFGLRVDDQAAVDVGELLVRGYAVCRHLAAVTAQVLNEAGFPAVMVVSKDHAWVEVDGVVVDASVRSFTQAVAVGDRDELRRVERPEARQFVEDHYLYPQRRQLEWDCDAELQ